jgi:hypothetical protein
MGSVIEQIAGLFSGSGRRPQEKTVKSIAMPTRQSVDDIMLSRMVKCELMHWYRDILSFITIDNPYFAAVRVYETRYQSIYTLAVKATDFIHGVIVGFDRDYHLIEVNGERLIVDTLPRLTDYTLLKSVMVESINSGLFAELKKTFGILLGVYDALDSMARLDGKPMVKIEGLTNLFGKTDGMDHSMSAYLKEIIDNQVRTILQGDYGVVDAGTSVDYVSTAVNSLTERIDFFKSELARLLKRPQTELYGIAPQGMNATGEYDMQSNLRNDISMLEQVLCPFLDEMGIGYQIHNPLAVDEISKLLRVIDEVNVSSLPDDAVTAITQSLKEKVLVYAGKPL